MNTLLGYIDTLQVWRNDPSFWLLLLMTFFMALALLLLERSNRAAIKKSTSSTEHANARQNDQSSKQRQSVEKLAKQEAKLLKKEEQIRNLLSTSDFARALLSRAGLESQNALRVASDKDKIRKIAEKIPQTALNILNVASNQTSIKFDLQESEQKEPVEYPTNDIEPIYMRDPSQLSELLPEDLVLDDDTFFNRLAQNELRILQAYQRVVTQKLLYILIDDSGSMDQNMLDRNKRFEWARGVTLKQLKEAQKGNAKFFLRTFTTTTSPMKQALTPQEAEAAEVEILELPQSNGGTDIFRALVTAISDIREKGGNFSGAEILIITDGEDDIDTNELKKLLRNDIKLHVAIIGTESKALQQIATTYRHFE